jgi:hypothetical protein
VNAACRLGILLALLVPAAPAAADDEPSPRPRFSIGAGIGGIQALHLDAGVWVVPALSIEARAWILPSPGFGSDITGFDGGLLAHFGSERHRLLVNAGIIGGKEGSQAFHYAPMAGIGYERRYVCFDFRIIAGAFFPKKHSGRAIYPAATLTWSLRFPSTDACTGLKSRRSPP